MFQLSSRAMPRIKISGKMSVLARNLLYLYLTSEDANVLVERVQWADVTGCWQCSTAAAAAAVRWCHPRRWRWWRRASSHSCQLTLLKHKRQQRKQRMPAVSYIHTGLQCIMCVCEALFYRWNGSTLRMREYAKRGEFDYKELYWFWFGSREYSKINRNLWTDDETLWWMIITCDKTWRLACNVDMCTVTDLRLSACGRACV